MLSCFLFLSRALCSQQLTLGSVIVVDTPGLRNPRHSGKDRAAGFSEFCHNYLQERLLEHHFTHTFTNVLDRCTQVQDKLPGVFFFVCMSVFQIMDIMANWRGFCCVLAVGESACRFWSPWGQSSKCGVCYRPTRTAGNPSTLSLTSLVTSSYQFWKIMLPPLRKLPFQDQDVRVCVLRFEGRRVTLVAFFGF